MNKSILAVIIPAWKAKYLRDAIASILAQSDLRFDLYVFDDCAPSGVRDICKEFYDVVNFRYHRFDENMGGVNLAAHWHRCIDYVGKYEWIWLFSDDDIANGECVSSFYSALEEDRNSVLFRFPLSCIDENSKLIANMPNHPRYDGVSYLKDRLRNRSKNYVVEYVFSRQAFLESGRFPEFDLAWGADIGLWAKLQQVFPLRQIESGRVFWRQSTDNITPDGSEKIVARKLNAQLEFLNWIQSEPSFRNGLEILDPDIKYYFGACTRNALSVLSAKTVMSIIRQHAGHFAHTSEVNAYFFMKLRITRIGKLVQRGLMKFRSNLKEKAMK